MKQTKWNTAEWQPIGGYCGTDYQTFGFFCLAATVTVGLR
jgi:hypothetical protein